MWWSMLQLSLNLTIKRILKMGSVLVRKEAPVAPVHLILDNACAENAECVLFLLII